MMIEEADGGSPDHPGEHSDGLTEWYAVVPATGRVYGAPAEAFTAHEEKKQQQKRASRAHPHHRATLLQLGSHVGMLSEAE
ncbi:unnamed protein product [Boreogadus saida]